jgi:allantoin racemase
MLGKRSGTRVDGPALTRVLYLEPVGTDLYDAYRQKLLDTVRAPTTEVTVRHLEGHPELAGPMLSPVPRYLDALVEQVLAAEQEGYDVAIIGCCSDPALLDARRTVSIPVIGPLQAAASAAAALGKRLGILFPAEHSWKTTLSWVRASLRAYGLAEVVGPIGFIEMHEPSEEPILGKADLSLEEVLARFRRPLREAGVCFARRLLELESDPADVVLFGCTLWGGMLAEVQEALGGRVFDPVVTAIKVAELAAGLGDPFFSLRH